MERLGAALGKPTVKRARDTAHGVLEEAEPLCELFVTCREDGGAHEDVRVAVDVFRERVNNDVGTCREGRGVVRAHESGIDED
jgi:hypothetical protein